VYTRGTANLTRGLTSSKSHIPVPSRWKVYEQHGTSSVVTTKKISAAKMGNTKTAATN